MIRTLSLMILTALPLTVAAQDMVPLIQQDVASDFRPLPLRQIVRTVVARYAGRPVAVDIKTPSDSERALGAQLVYQVRLLTADRNLLDIRLDASNGRFLQVSGRGQLQARSAASKR
jgi:uncharacterized membrane protein YkoI